MTCLWTGASSSRRPHDAAMTDIPRLPSELRRPDLPLHQLSRRHPFDRPATLLARVDGPHDRQRLTDGTLLWHEPAPDEHERTCRTEQALQRLGLDRTRRPYPEWPIAVPVVVRPGSAWWSWDERDAWLGLRYGSSLCDVLSGEVLTVTARGWRAHLDDLHGCEPRAAWEGTSTVQAATAT